MKEKEKKTFLQSPLLEVTRKFLASVVGNNEKERWFWVFSNEKRSVSLELGVIGSVSTSSSGARQWLSRFGVER